MAVDPTRLEEIPSDALSPAQALVVLKLMGDRGRVPTPFKVWLHSPVLADRLHDLGSFLANGTSLSLREAKIAILLMAAHWHAEYVFKMQAGEAREAGLPEAAEKSPSLADKASLSSKRIHFLSSAMNAGLPICSELPRVTYSKICSSLVRPNKSRTATPLPRPVCSIRARYSSGTVFP